MPKRGYDNSSELHSSSRNLNSVVNTLDFKPGEIITDVVDKKWKLGRSIGVGGFGVIYETSDNLSKDECNSYVAKIERHSNGPLFVEVNCYLRIARLHMIQKWKEENNLNFLGMPHYVASGSHWYNGEKYRFLILPKYTKDLDKIFKEKRVFNMKTVLIISIQILNVLQYIHTKGYVHSDIKASNIMLGTDTDLSQHRIQQPQQHEPWTITTRNRKNTTKRVTRRNLRPISNTVTYIDDIPYLDEVLNMHEKSINFDMIDMPRKVNAPGVEHIYLLDYGLATKYLLSNGDHKEFSTDERRAHAGTLLFCSRDAHKGVPSRRSDLECLAYNMVYWLTGSLPWIEDLESPKEVEKKKIRCFRDLKSFLEYCFSGDCPDCLLDYYTYLNKLQFEETPDYEYCRKLFKKAIKRYGYKDDSILDFDNIEGFGKMKKVKGKTSNRKQPGDFLKASPLMPLHSNIIFKRPKLRKKKYNVKVDSMMNWSKILTDPEDIIKQAREKKLSEEASEVITNLSLSELESMNPTYAMLEVFSRCKEKEISPRYKGDNCLVGNIEGYTPAMMSVYTKMKERQEIEYELDTCINNNYTNLKESQMSTRKQRKKSYRLSSNKITKIKSSYNVPRKKDLLPLKKSSSVQLVRIYSLRG